MSPPPHPDQSTLVNSAAFTLSPRTETNQVADNSR